MSDLQKSTRPERDRPVTVNVGPELQPRCRAKINGARCTRPADHEGDHRTDSPECDPDNPGGLMPDIVSGYRAADVALRATYRVGMRESEARRLEQFADQLAEDEDDAVAVPYLRFIQSAAVDLMNIAGFLEHWADQGGDGVDRHEIPVAALVMRLYPKIERAGEKLMKAVSAAQEAAQ